MCGIAGVSMRRTADEGDVRLVGRMIGQLTHRGPDGTGIVKAGPAVLGSARLAIVDVEHGRQPFSNEAGDIHVVFNGEIYNHRELGEALRRRGHVLRSNSDGEIIAHLYEDFGDQCFAMLDGQFAIAISNTRSRSLVLARDPMGICPLHWIETPEGLFFCSEIKGLRAVGAASPRLEPEALLQVSYFGTVCAPLTFFSGVKQLAPAQYLSFESSGTPKLKRYWSLAFPRDGEHAGVSEREAIRELRQRVEDAVTSHTQGEYQATCFLSGGIDSAVIGALLGRHYGNDGVKAFCATSDHKKIDEGDAAHETAQCLGLDLQRVETDDAAIAGIFPRLIWHAESPVISTEAAALMVLAGEARRHSKIVLTGEGADEAFGGYLAFRQFKALGFLTRSGLSALRAMVRPVLQGYYGSDCLLPPEQRLDDVRDHLGFVPAQAYEWEFYRAAMMPLLSPEYRAMAAAGRQWHSFAFDQEATRGRHWLDRSLHVAYQVMLPNYLLGAHGDRIFAANSVEGRYPFLARRVVDYCATLPPHFKLKRLREKYILRRAAARWLPADIAQRPKRRFVMPFGTPFIGPKAPPLYAELLAPHSIAAYGYFDPVMVKRALDALARPTGSGNKAKLYLERLMLGLAVNLVVSMQLWHYLFVAGNDCRMQLTQGLASRSNIHESNRMAAA